MSRPTRTSTRDCSRLSTCRRNRRRRAAAISLLPPTFRQGADQFVHRPAAVRQKARERRNRRENRLLSRPDHLEALMTVADRARPKRLQKEKVQPQPEQG